MRNYFCDNQVLLHIAEGFNYVSQDVHTYSQAQAKVVLLMEMERAVCKNRFGGKTGAILFWKLRQGLDMRKVEYVLADIDAFLAEVYLNFYQSNNRIFTREQICAVAGMTN